MNSVIAKTQLAQKQNEKDRKNEKSCKKYDHQLIKATLQNKKF